LTIDAALPAPDPVTTNDRSSCGAVALPITGLLCDVLTSSV